MTGFYLWGHCGATKTLLKKVRLPPDVTLIGLPCVLPEKGCGVSLCFTSLVFQRLQKRGSYNKGGVTYCVRYNCNPVYKFYVLFTKLVQLKPYIKCLSVVQSALLINQIPNKRDASNRRNSIKTYRQGFDISL